MNGIICINKPRDFTSFDVVAVARKLFKTRKIGHGGTLDPMAEGVLPLFVGNATRAVDFCPNTDKEYVAGFKFGITTDTQDITGNILTKTDEYVSRNKLALIERYHGEIMQTPPMYSAVKINGQKLYDIARKGQVVDRPARKINLYDVKIEDYADNCGTVRIRCSKGTYVRTFIHDFGQELGVGAVMTSLTRTMSSGFTLDDCYTLDYLQEKVVREGFETLGDLLIPLEQFYACYPKARLDVTQTRLFGNGAVLVADRVRLDKIYSGLYTVVDSNDVLVALARISADHSLEVVQRFQPPDMKFAKGVRKKLDE